MKSIYPLLVFLTIAFGAHTVSAGDNGSHSRRDSVFESIDTGGTLDYLKQEQSGCTTRLSLNENFRGFFILHDIRCRAVPERRESTNDIAGSVIDIVERFNLKDEIRSKSAVGINIGWSMNHEALIRFINYDESWPENIYEHIKEKHTEREDRCICLRERLREEITKSEIYDPFIAAMGELGCQMTLKEYFVDGLFFDEHNITKEMLIERGVFSRQEANKDEYPVMKGHIEFDLKCDSHVGRKGDTGVDGSEDEGARGT